MALNREQKIQRARLILKKIKEQIAPYQKKLEAAEAELWAAEKSFDKGERVEVTQTCKRGCCVENQFTGVIVSPTANGLWNVRNDASGHICEYVYKGDIKRL